MYYSDAEIYGDIINGIDEHILANLNGCSVKQIKQAYERHLNSITRHDVEYNRILEIHAKTNKLQKENYVEIGRQKEPEIIITSIQKEPEKIEKPRKKRVNFQYTSENIKNILDKINQGCSASSVYCEMFRNVSEEDKPSLKSFYTNLKKWKSSEL